MNGLWPRAYWRRLICHVLRREVCRAHRFVHQGEGTSLPLRPQWLGQSIKHTGVGHVFLPRCTWVCCERRPTTTIGPARVDPQRVGGWAHSSTRHLSIFHERVLAVTTTAEAPHSAWFAKCEVFSGRGSTALGLRQAQLEWANPQSWGGVGRQGVV